VPGLADVVVLSLVRLPRDATWAQARVAGKCPQMINLYYVKSEYNWRVFRTADGLYVLTVGHLVQHVRLPI
jgi:hypothetical protein